MADATTVTADPAVKPPVTDATAKTDSPATATVDTAKTDASTKPAISTPDADKTKSEKTPDEAAPLTAEELRAKAHEALGLKGKDPETVEHWKARFGGLTKSHQTTVQERKEYEEILASAGLKKVSTKDGPKLVADEKYVAKKSAELVGDVYKGLSEQDRALSVEEPEKFAKAIVKKVLEAVTPNLSPNASDEEVEIAETRKTALREEVAGKLPDYPALAPFIDDILQSDQVSDSFKKWMNSGDDRFKEGLALLYGRVAHQVAPLIADQKARESKLAAKKAAALADPNLSDQGTRRGGHEATVSEKAAIDAIIGAKP